MTRRGDRKQSPKARRAPRKPAAAISGDGRSASELTDKQRAFVEHYLTTWNATEAARRAGYSAKTAQEIGSENLSKPIIRTLIEQRIGELKMTADEVLLRLAGHARGDMGDFLDARGNINLAAARRARRLHLVKRVSDTDKGTTIELYDSQAALIQIGRALKLFVDVQEHSGTVNLNHDLDSAIEKAYGNAGDDPLTPKPNAG